MSGFLLYIARSGLYLGLFYAFYLLVMRRTTFFSLNRVILLVGSAACALLPLLKVRTTSYAIIGAGPLSVVGTEGPARVAVQESVFPWQTVLFAVYGLGALAVILLTLVSALRMIRLIRRGQERQLDGYRAFVLEGRHPSFCVGKTIVISEEDLEGNPVILTHEKMHVRKRHYMDLYLFRIIQIVWWWNPLVWIMRTELGLLHEYEADEGVIKKGVDATQYQLLLVRKAVGEQRFTLASGFQHAKLKNRIAMMIKPHSNGWMRLSYLALIPLLAISVYACNPVKDNSSSAGESELTAPETKTMSAVDSLMIEYPDGVPFELIETKPSFQGGDANEFARWVNEHMTYPQSAKDAGVQGRLYLQFAIDTDGSMKDIQLVRGIHPDLDAEALRVLNSCTEKWTPGMQNGQAVKVTFMFPIVFKLR